MVPLCYMEMLKVATSDLSLNDLYSAETWKIESIKSSRSHFWAFFANWVVFWSTPQAVKTFGALHIARSLPQNTWNPHFPKIVTLFSWWNASLLGQWKMKTEIVILLQTPPPASGSIFYVVRDPRWCIGLYFAWSRVQIHTFCEDSKPGLNTLRCLTVLCCIVFFSPAILRRNSRKNIQK